MALIKPPPFTLKSDWTPSAGQIPDIINDLIRADVSYFDHSFWVVSLKSNLLPFEVEAPQKLVSNKHIVIKPADKGCSIVVMNCSQYLWEGYRQLSDVNYYTKLDKPIYLSTVPLVTTILQ